MSFATDVDFIEKITALFQPDVLVPLQYLKAIKTKAEAIPEKDLMLADLEDAVYSFQKYLLFPDKKGKILFKEAERWIFDDDGSWIFSYRNVCDVLGIDGDYLRSGLLRWKEKHLSFRLEGKDRNVRK